MALRSLLAVAFLTLAPACGESEEDATAAVAEQAREDAVERAEVSDERACRSSLLALENDRNTLDGTLRNLENERTVAVATLATARSQPTPNIGLIAAQETALTRIERELTRVRVEREALAPRIDAQRAECARLVPSSP